MKNVETVTVLSTLRGLGFSSIWIYSAIYLKTNLGLSYIQDGLVITIGSAIAAGVQMYAGILADKFGYKRFIVLFIGVSTFLFALLTVSSTLRNSPTLYPVIFMGLMVANSAQAPATNALVSESSSVKLRGFSMLRVGNNVGWGIGPALGGFLLFNGNYSYLFLFGLATTLLAFLISFLLKEVKSTETRTVRFHAGNRMLIILAVVAMLLFVVQAQESVTLSNYAKIIRQLQYTYLGLIYLTNGLVVILTQGIIYRITRKIGNYLSFIFGGFIYTFGFFSYAFFSTLSGFIFATVILTIGENFAFPAGYAMVSLVSKPENIGRNMGTYTAFISSGRAIGPLIGGVVLTLTTNVYDLWGLTTVWGFVGVLLFTIAFRNKSGLTELPNETATEL